MMTELHISNFKVFEDIRIEPLKHVNLFTGKNNVGKTALLEALRILAAPDHASVYASVLIERGTFEKYSLSNLEAFFNKYNIDKINDEKLEAVIESNDRQLAIKRIQSPYGKKPGYLVYFNDRKQRELVEAIGKFGLDVIPKDKAVYLAFGNGDSQSVQKFWDKIVLTDKEEDVLHLLRDTIIPNLERMDVKPERTLVRLKNEPTPVPLKTLGDGAQRMLQMAIALVNARDNLLLIDEIEAGLHYSVLEILWEKIFEYAQKWNIQVFVTTHSHDAVKSFTYVMEKPENKDAGAYFRLQRNRKTDKIEAVAYDLEDLEISLESNLEPR